MASSGHVLVPQTNYWGGEIRFAQFGTSLSPGIGGWVCFQEDQGSNIAMKGKKSL